MILIMGGSMLTVKRCGRFHKQSKKMVIMCNFTSYMHGHVWLPASPSKRRGGEQRHGRVEADNGKRRKAMEGGLQLRKS
jgi:hypothetical protein